MSVPQKIAIIEDDHSIRQLYTLKLELAGYTVKSAVNGREGLQLCETFLPDLVLLDIRMPEMNGDEMLAEVRAQEWGETMKVIILTNISRDEMPMSLRFLRYNQYIVKAHHTPSQVLETVKAVLSEG